MSAVRSAPFRDDPPPGKRGFAKAAAAFAKRARRIAKLPGFPVLWIASAAAAALMIVTGGFGTGDVAAGPRVGFWAMLMGWSALKWQVWFAVTVRRPEDWLRAAAIGAILLCLPLPIEIALCARFMGFGGMMPDVFGTWGRALAIGSVVLVTILVLTRAIGHRPFGASAEPAATPLPPDGILARARVAPDALAAIEAEDHYCRVHHRDGTSALIHYRFGDALGEVAGMEGAQVHRGAWVSAAAVEGAEREGRRWDLVLGGGRRVAVSATYAPEARRRGWLRPVR
ncbi:MAG: LytTR family transcriptional regulator [Sphingomonadales bacterium]|nr:MAG: LytTR family transcriptional regulator [Sphingomonadales bacterium]